MMNRQPARKYAILPSQQSNLQREVTNVDRLDSEFQRLDRPLGQRCLNLTRANRGRPRNLYDEIPNGLFGVVMNRQPSLCPLIMSESGRVEITLQTLVKSAVDRLRLHCSS